MRKLYSSIYININMCLFVFRFDSYIERREIYILNKNERKNLDTGFRILLEVYHIF